VNSKKNVPKNILLAVDGSDHAISATELVRDLPLDNKSNIAAISILIPRHAQLATSLEGALHKTREILSPCQANIKTELIGGYPAEVIIQKMAKNNYDLTVLGAKGLRNTLGILLGGVAQQVVEYSCCPVLVVRAPYSGLKRILLVVDGSEHSHAATQYLSEFPLHNNCHLYIMNVLPPAIDYETIVYSWPTGLDVAPPIPSEDLQVRLKEQAAIERQRGEELLKTTESIFSQLGMPISCLLQEGDAATQILEFADQEQIDLIVAGSRGLSRISSWLLGSVSRKLVHYAKCSVMIVKTPSI